ncbi:MAG: hypothetical protein M1839_005047 [Geoglossum umbratile]|nr:MAG: hypothetical protein M1839_005047 [Geoglossum umbratile]
MTKLNSVTQEDAEAGKSLLEESAPFEDERPGGYSLPPPPRNLISRILSPPFIIHAPAREAIRSTAQVFEIDPDISGSSAWLYAGPPSPKLDQAWEELLEHSVIRITDQEMHALGREAEGVRFTDGSGYLGQLAVFHNLHCIQSLHRFINVDYYFPNVTALEYKLLQAHNVHCLDALRQAAMCHGDAAPITMRWGKSQPIPLANSSSPHECVDWSALTSWAAERHVNPFEPGLVVHPTLGPAYAKANLIGVVIDL